MSSSSSIPCDRTEIGSVFLSLRSETTIQKTIATVAPDREFSTLNFQRMRTGLCTICKAIIHHAIEACRGPCCKGQVIVGEGDQNRVWGEVTKIKENGRPLLRKKKEVKKKVCCGVHRDCLLMLLAEQLTESGEKHPLAEELKDDLIDKIPYVHDLPWNHCKKYRVACPTCAGMIGFGSFFKRCARCIQWVYGDLIPKEDTLEFVSKIITSKRLRMIRNGISLKDRIHSKFDNDCTAKSKLVKYNWTEADGGYRYGDNRMISLAPKVRLLEAATIRKTVTIQHLMEFMIKDLAKIVEQYTHFD